MSIVVVVALARTLTGGILGRFCVATVSLVSLDYCTVQYRSAIWRCNASPSVSVTALGLPDMQQPTWACN